MRRLAAGISGTHLPPALIEWADLKLPDPWPAVLGVLAPQTQPRPLQAKALGQQRILETRRNLIVASPTSSGKSLVGLLVLLNAVRHGHRAVLLEPLRALAREKAEELQTACKPLSEILGRKIEVCLSSGDYRLEHEHFSDPPPDQGELLIATPERFEAILRNPAHDNWLSSVAAVCVDEAHLISTPRRGPTIEYLLTTLLCQPAPPRLVLLSATLGDTERARIWLNPCDVIQQVERTPPLEKEVWQLEEGEDLNAVVLDAVQQILADPPNRLLIFVYQTKSAERLARLIQQELGKQRNSNVALAYHAKLSPTQREQVRHSFTTGHCQCVVATTALGLGVNLPATHVLVRDNTFPGAGRLNVSELLQMLGRAGRNHQAGMGAVLVTSKGGWSADELVQELIEERLPPLKSSFECPHLVNDWQNARTTERDQPQAKMLAGYLARQSGKGVTLEEVHTFLHRSFGGKALVGQLKQSLAWLMDSSRFLAYQDEQERYHLTALGLAATKAVLPLRLATGFAQLLRDLFSIDSVDRLIAQWKPLDHLIILNLLSDWSPRLRPFSETLAEQVDVWMESHSRHTPLLYREWLAGQVGQSRAVEVLGSLGIQAAAEKARQIAYLAVFGAILLYERGAGRALEDLERRWKIKDWAGIEERWRDQYLWLLSGLAQILDLKCFYYQLRQECAANDGRIRRVKTILRELRHQTFELQEQLKYCSPLGPLLLGIRHKTKAANGNLVGQQSIRKLEQAGIQTLQELSQYSLDELVQLGIRRALANQIQKYVKGRLQ